MGRQSLSRMLAQPSFAGGRTNGRARPRAVFRFPCQHSRSALDRVASAPSACSRPDRLSRPVRPTRTAAVAIQWCDGHTGELGGSPWRDRWGHSPGATGDIQELWWSEHSLGKARSWAGCWVGTKWRGSPGRRSPISGCTACCRSWQPGPPRRTDKPNATVRAQPPGAADKNGAFAGFRGLALRA